MMVSKNVIANLLIKIWVMISTFIFVPIYLGLLNEESYGLITFFTTLQTAMNFLGLGLSKTLRRKFTLPESNEKNIKEKYQLLKSVEFIYSIIFLCIVIITFSMSSYFASEWLDFDTLPMDTVINSIRIMGFSIGLQLFANLYVGCLQGQERQVEANIYMFIWSFLKNVGVIFVIVFIKKDIFLFYSWYMLIDLIYFIYLRGVIIHRLKSLADCTWSYKDLNNLKTIIDFAAGLMIISIGYVINTQLDKTIISGNFSLTELGAYNSCFTLGMLTCTITSAVGIALFSRFSVLNHEKKEEELQHLFISTNKILSIFIVVFGSFVCVFSKEIMTFWLGNEKIVYIVQNVAPLVVFGSMLLSLQELPYNFFLAKGITKYNVFMSFFMILYVLIVTPILISNLGLFGGGLAWLIESTAITLFYLIFFDKKFLNIKYNWIINDFIFPLLLSFTLAVLIKFVCIQINLNIYLNLLIAVMSGFIILIIFMFMFCRNTILSLKKEI